MRKLIEMGRGEGGGLGEVWELGNLDRRVVVSFFPSVWFSLGLWLVRLFWSAFISYLITFSFSHAPSHFYQMSRYRSQKVFCIIAQLNQHNHRWRTTPMVAGNYYVHPFSRTEVPNG